MTAKITLNPSAEEMAVQELRANLPDLNVREGTALRRLLINPFTLMTQPLVRELRRLEQRLSFADIADLTEDDLDRLAANIFATRRPGASARGSVRLYFREASNISVESSATFKSKRGVLFRAQFPVAFSAGEMRLNADGDRFFVDVLAEAVSPGVSGNVDPGEIISMADGPSDVVEVRNMAAFAGGLPRETNAQFMARLPISITTRVIESEPGIQEAILGNFPQVTHVQPIGFGDPEMDRDILTGSDLMLGGVRYEDVGGVHIGGHTDIYVRTLGNVERGVTLINANGDVRPDIIFGRAAENYLEVAPAFAAPVLAIMSIQLGDPATGVCGDVTLVEGRDYVVEPLLPAYAFSTKDQTRVRLLPSGPHYDSIFTGDGKSLFITYLTNPDVARIQSFIEQSRRRPLNANVLVKSFAPVFVDVDVTYLAVSPSRLQSGQSEATPDAVSGEITRFLQRAENRDGFNVDDLYRVLYGLPIARVNKPIGVKTELVRPNGTRVLQPVVSDTSSDTEFQVLDRGTLPSLLDSIDVALATNLGHVGVSIGDRMVFTWDGGSAEREIVNVLRASPDATALTIVRMASQPPRVSKPVSYVIRRDTVINVASVPRTSALIPRRVRALRLAI